MNFSFNLQIGLSISLVLSGCSENNKYARSLNDEPFSKCGYDGTFECTREQISYIKDVRYLIEKIGEVATKDKSLHKHFFQYSTPSGNGNRRDQIYLLGESHTDIVNLIDNFSFIEKTLKKGDRILFEGAPAGVEKPLCAQEILLKMRCTLEYDRLGYDYHPKLRAEYCSSQADYMYQTSHALNYEVLNLSAAECLFWDDPVAMNLADQTKSLRMRNRSLLQTAIKRSPDTATFIIAGNFHSPIGEYAHFKSKQFYSKNVIIKDDVVSLYRDFASETTTEELFKGFAIEPVTYLSHKKLFSNGDFFLPLDHFAAL